MESDDKQPPLPGDHATNPPSSYTRIIDALQINPPNATSTPAHGPAESASAAALASPTLTAINTVILSHVPNQRTLQYNKDSSGSRKARGKKEDEEECADLHFNPRFVDGDADISEEIFLDQSMKGLLLKDILSCPLTPFRAKGYFTISELTRGGSFPRTKYQAGCKSVWLNKIFEILANNAKYLYFLRVGKRWQYSETGMQTLGMSLPIPSLPKRDKLRAPHLSHLNTDENGVSKPAQPTTQTAAHSPTQPSAQSPALQLTPSSTPAKSTPHTTPTPGTRATPTPISPMPLHALAPAHTTTSHASLSQTNPTHIMPTPTHQPSGFFDPSFIASLHNLYTQYGLSPTAMPQHNPPQFGSSAQYNRHAIPQYHPAKPVILTPTSRSGQNRMDDTESDEEDDEELGGTNAKFPYRCLRSIGVVGGRNTWEISTGSGDSKIKSLLSVGDLLALPPAQRDAIFSVIAEQEQRVSDGSSTTSSRDTTPKNKTTSPSANTDNKNKRKSDNTPSDKRQKESEELSDYEGTNNNNGKSSTTWNEETSPLRKKAKEGEAPGQTRSEDETTQSHAETIAPFFSSLSTLAEVQHPSHSISIPPPTTS